MWRSFDASRSLNALEQDNTIVAVIEMSKARWLIAALVPGFKRQPPNEIDADAPSLLKLLQRWRDQAGKAGHTIKRIASGWRAGRGRVTSRPMPSILPACVGSAPACQD
ncbi:hypothetical protein [Mesorhizobium sp. M0254]|uniref:hypothetical protein n=1 Tax=Mesorhizobium sp. M0254 TaxID=2956927 RepID=UPI00333AD47E